MHGFTSALTAANAKRADRTHALRWAARLRRADRLFRYSRYKLSLPSPRRTTETPLEMQSKALGDAERRLWRDAFGDAFGDAEQGRGTGERLVKGTGERPFHQPFT